MLTEKIIVGIILASIGLIFFYNNKNMSKGAAEFYQKMYTAKNLKVMFKFIGIFLMLAGIILILNK